MEVVYETSLFDEINGEICAARLKNKVIEKIILTTDEWSSLLKELDLVNPYHDSKYLETHRTYMGIPILVK